MLCVGESKKGRISWNRLMALFMWNGCWCILLFDVYRRTCCLSLCREYRLGNCSTESLFRNDKRIHILKQLLSFRVPFDVYDNLDILVVALCDEWWPLRALQCSNLQRNEWWMRRLYNISAFKSNICSPSDQLWNKYPKERFTMGYTQTHFDRVWARNTINVQNNAHQRFLNVKGTNERGIASS